MKLFAARALTGLIALTLIAPLAAQFGRNFDCRVGSVAFRPFEKAFPPLELALQSRR